MRIRVVARRFSALLALAVLAVSLAAPALAHGVDNAARSGLDDLRLVHPPTQVVTPLRSKTAESAAKASTRLVLAVLAALAGLGLASGAHSSAAALDAVRPMWSGRVKPKRGPPFLLP